MNDTTTSIHFKDSECNVIINLTHISAKFICLAHMNTSHSRIKNMAETPC